MAEKIDANLVGFAIAEELTVKVLPAKPKFRTREPNSFSDFGGNFSMTARAPFSPSRQRKKGVITDLDADGGFNEDLTMGNMKGMLQGFFFADIREKGINVENWGVAFAAVFTRTAATVFTSAAHGLTTGFGPYQLTTTTTLPAGLALATNYWVVVIDANTFSLATTYANAVATVPVIVTTTDAGTGVHTMTKQSAVLLSDQSFNVDNPAGYLARSIVRSTGFLNNANNVVADVTSVTGPKIVVSGAALVDENLPPDTAKLIICGYKFAAATVDIQLTTGGFKLNRASGAFDFTTLQLIPGEWVFIGGDSAPNKFVNASNVPGYARIAVGGILPGSITFDKSTFTPSAEVGTGLQIALYFGSVQRNESLPALIKTRYYRTERTLGRDAVGVMSENLVGAVTNELTWNSPLPGSDSKVNLDMGFIALDNQQRTGTQGPLSTQAGATLYAALGESAINTASNVYRLRMAIVDPTTLNPTALFARVTEFSVNIKNNVSAAKAQGTLGGFDVIVGRFDVGGSLTAYFSDVAAVAAIRNNSNVTFDAIYSRDNMAIVLDLPLIALGNGRLKVEQDAAIMVPLDETAAESPFGNTALITYFNYVPNAGVA